MVWSDIWNGRSTTHLHGGECLPAVPLLDPDVHHALLEMEEEERRRGGGKEERRRRGICTWPDSSSPLDASAKGSKALRLSSWDILAARALKTARNVS